MISGRFRWRWRDWCHRAAATGSFALGRDQRETALRIERQTPNAERRTPNAERRTPNANGLTSAGLDA
jgi:hypothetical protein